MKFVEVERRKAKLQIPNSPSSVAVPILSNRPAVIAEVTKPQMVKLGLRRVDKHPGSSRNG